MLLKCSWLAIFAILLFRAARWAGSIWMMALWDWRVRRVPCWGFGGSGGRLLRWDQVRGGCGEEGEGWGRCVGGWMYGISSSCCLRCSVRFAQYSCSLHNVIIRDACAPLLLFLDRGFQSSFSRKYLKCSDRICVSIIGCHTSTLRPTRRTFALSFYGDVPFPSCFQREHISGLGDFHLRFA